MSRTQLISTVTSFVKDRFPIEKMDFKHMITQKEVPIHKMSWAYYTGGLVLFFLIIQIATGLMLLFYYKPTVSDAHESVSFLTDIVSMGGLIRNMHAWAASLMIFCVIVHLLTAFAMKAFAKPRELTWVTGVVLLLLTFGFGFTGYLLPWNQIAVNATKVGLQSIEEVGAYLPAGLAHYPTVLRETIQGEATLGQATLSRFFAIHVVVLPFTLLAVLGLHLFFVQLHGMSQGVDRPTKKREFFFPFFALKDLSEWGFAFLALFLLALCLPFESFFPYPLAEPYNALGSTPEGIKPEWYFYFLYYPMEMLPFWVIIIITKVLVIGLFLAPWIFRNTSRRVLATIAIAAGMYFGVMTLFGSTIYKLVKGG
ncbi:MAG: cytochrome b N-terminal domain-containing protein [bacterium]|nr:cytochrome b N-terminal domain-containing protein [bacterium]